MQENGVTKISALPLLYEEMVNQLELIEEHEPVIYRDLNRLSNRLAKPVDPAIISLPAMRVVPSSLKNNPGESDADGFRRWMQMKNLSSSPGRHEGFEYQTDTGDVVIQRISDDF